VSYSTQNVSSEKDLKLVKSPSSGTRANWIFYRLSDMILIKAEALIERNQPGDLDLAFSLIDLVNRRANDAITGRSSTLKKTDYVDSQAAMEQLVLEERQREFLFEGKRWYDLVRASRRDNNTTKLQAYALQKYKQDRNVIKIKLTDPNYIYFPYAKSELKVNPQLQQNPAFNKGDESVLTK
jgi:hypothetical protein